MDHHEQVPNKALAWRRIHDSGQRGHGAIRGADAIAAGLHPRSLSRLADTMQWDRPYRGVYILPGTRKTLRRDAAAALLAIGPEALLTGAAALHLYDILRKRPAVIDLVLPATARPAARAGIRLHRTRAYDAIRARKIDGLRAVHPTRALADLAPFSTPVEVARHIARAVALRQCTVEHASRELEVRSRFPGRADYLRAVKMLRNELTHSDGEQIARQHLKRAGLHPFPMPFPIEAGGVLLAEADIAIVEIRYDIEVDGPHHDLPEQVKADKARDRRLGRHGWTVDRFPIEMVTGSPKAFVREVLARVEQLRARHGSGH